MLYIYINHKLSPPTPRRIAKSTPKTNDFTLERIITFRASRMIRLVRQEPRDQANNGWEMCAY